MKSIYLQAILLAVDAKQILAKADELIDKIPGHIRDIIAKASIAFLAFLALIAFVVGWQWGVGDAQPGGMQIAKDNRDLFYLQQIREENAKKMKLSEDVQQDPLAFESQKERAYKQMSNTSNQSYLDEKAPVIEYKTKDDLRIYNRRPGFLDDTLSPGKTGDQGEKIIKDEKDNELLELKQKKIDQPMKQEAFSKETLKNSSGKKKKGYKFLE